MAQRKIKPDYLSQKQFDFLENWLQTNNIKDSAVKAGYSEKTAHVQGSRFLATTKAKKYITERMAEMDAEKIATSNEVLQYLTSVMRGEVKDQFDLDPSLSDRNKAANLLANILLKANEKSVIPVQIVNDIPRKNDIKPTKLTKILQESEETKQDNNNSIIIDTKDLTNDKQKEDDSQLTINKSNHNTASTTATKRTTRRGVLC